MIVKFADQEIESIWDLRSAVANTPPGESVTVTVVRRGAIQNFDIQLATRAVEREERAESTGLSLDDQEEIRKPTYWSSSPPKSWAPVQSSQSTST